MKVTKKKILLALGTSIGLVVLSLLTVICWLLITFHQFLPLVSKLPILLGMKTPQTYLILFQNNMELRPGGGFIGSYATLTVDKGRVGNVQVHNTYDADGQLHQHVEPYYIGRRYIQVHLYMRDSNFDVDFAKSAQKVASMYQLETGHHADTIIAIDLSYVQSIITVLSPVYVFAYNQTVTANNFFILTEYHADKHSFYGSTQKQDFLSSLFDSIKTKIETNKIVYIYKILQATRAAISQKHLLFASNNPVLQEIFTKSNLSSTLFDPRPNTFGVVNDFLGVNEANIGVNKSNYYLKRSLSHQVQIENSGVIDEDLTITYTNTTPKEEWPTGRYIAYVRLILPQNTKLTSIAIDGNIQKIIPAITDYRIYEKPGFVVPEGLEVDHMSEEGKTLYGFIIRVSYHTTEIVHIRYTLSQKISSDNPTYNLVIFKQPGMVNDPYTFSLGYPAQYHLASANVTLGQKTVPSLIFLTTTLDTDKHFILQLRK